MAGYNPGRFKVSMKKIKSLFVELNLTKAEIKSVKKNLFNIKRTLKSGDMQLAKVISLEPLLIACFSDEFDSVLIYEYPSFSTNNNVFFYTKTFSWPIWVRTH